MCDLARLFREASKYPAQDCLDSYCLGKYHTVQVEN